jgi:hypothetical protein
MKITKTIIKLRWILITQFGFNPTLFFQSIRGLPIYIYDFIKFRKNFNGKLKITPCFHDRYDEGGSTKSEYFWQDLIVARRINEYSPIKHVDVGSRVDGFVAHVASYREIEVLDVRPITTLIPGITFKQANLMDKESISEMIKYGGYCDSLSCLHTLEHFGLGRYGDPIDPTGFSKGLTNLSALIKKDGRLYLSTPMGVERVEFNANWVFSPITIIDMAKQLGLKLVKFDLVKTDSKPIECSIFEIESVFKRISTENYQLVLMEFIKQ